MQTTTVSFFRYKGFSNRIWGMSMMYKAKEPLKNTPGVQFFKPLGTGSGSGFSIIPDFGVYGVFIVWESEQLADNFLNSELFESFRAHSEEQYTIFLTLNRSKGSWAGFRGWVASEEDIENGPVAILTSATIRPRFLLSFWRMTPRVSRELNNFAGLVFSKGIGERPLMEQATFSVWKTKTEMESFAYQGFHRKVVEETIRRDGFAEQLFARFIPIKAIGSWYGTNPVQTVLEK